MGKISLENVDLFLVSKRNYSFVKNLSIKQYILYKHNPLETTKYRSLGCISSVENKLQFRRAHFQKNKKLQASV